MLYYSHDNYQARRLEMVRHAQLATVGGTHFELKARYLYNVVSQFISENPFTDSKDNNENMYIWDNCKKTQFIEAIDNLKIEAILKKINSVDVNVNEIVTDNSSLWEPETRLLKSRRAT